MTSDEHLRRVKRLTTLAQQEYGDGAYVELDDNFGEYYSLAVLEPTTLGNIIRMEMSYIENDRLPKVLSAFEAALLVLSGLAALDATLLLLSDKDAPLAHSQATSVWSEGFAAAKRLFDRSPTWTEQLATEWEATAARIDKAHDEWGGACLYVAESIRKCVTELRDRAKNAL